MGGFWNCTRRIHVYKLNMHEHIRIIWRSRCGISHCPGRVPPPGIRQYCLSTTHEGRRPLQCATHNITNSTRRFR